VFKSGEKASRGNNFSKGTPSGYTASGSGYNYESSGNRYKAPDVTIWSLSFCTKLPITEITVRKLHSVSDKSWGYYKITQPYFTGFIIGWRLNIEITKLPEHVLQVTFLL
jgi:hypothetical protein